MKKLIALLFVGTLIVSCSKENEVTQAADTSADYALDISAYDNSNLGIYKGVFSTYDSSQRGTFVMEVKEGNSSRASLTLVNGQEIKFNTSAVIEEGTNLANIEFVSDGSSFKFSVDRDGGNPVFTNVNYLGSDSAIKVLKETSRGAVVAQTGTWGCDAGCSGSGTWNLTFTTGDGTGDYPSVDGNVTTMIMFNGADIGGTTNEQNNCVDDGNVTSCELTGITSTVGAVGGIIGWTGTHSYLTATTANCSQASGIWSGGPLTGTWTSDVTCFNQGNFSFNPEPFTPNAEGTGCATEDQTFVPGNWTASGVTGTCGSGTADQWLSFTANATGLTIFTTFGSTLSTPYWTVYDNTLTEVDCNVGNSFGAITLTGLTPGNDYLLQISGGVDVGYCIEDFTVPTGPPANDLCANAEPIACGDTVNGNTTSATDSDTSRGNDVWYSFDGSSQPAGTIVAVSLCASSYDTWLGVYTDCTFGTLVNSNDDNNSACGSFGPSYLEFSNDGSTNYIIRVDGFNASSFGAYELSITCTPPPPPPSCDPAAGTGTTGPIADGACPVDDLFTTTETTVGIVGTDYAIDGVAMNITHTWVSDLEIKLVAPDGTTSLDLSIANGGSGDNYTATLFQDGGADITTASAPFTGTFEPEGGTFATAFAGQPVNGDWSLAICDNTSADPGSLDSWNICFVPITAPTAAPSASETANLNLSEEEAANKRAINAQQKAAYLEQRKKMGKQ